MILRKINDFIILCGEIGVTFPSIIYHALCLMLLTYSSESSGNRPPFIDSTTGNTLHHFLSYELNYKHSCFSFSSDDDEFPGEICFHTLV